MLTFEEKLAVIAKFPELRRKDVSLRRVNFHYEDSAYDKKIVVYHLHPNGNGFVFAGLLDGYDTDDRGFVNIRDYSSVSLQELIRASIRSLAPRPVSEQAVVNGAQREERWVNAKKESLLLVQEDDMWYVYSGLNLEMAFETYEEAEQYLREEGFAKSLS